MSNYLSTLADKFFPQKRDYVREQVIHAPLSLVWEYVSDLRNFAKFNDYHQGFKFVSEQEQGIGTRFLVHHTFKPIIPYGPCMTECEVLEWEKSSESARLQIFERPQKLLSQHIQWHTLEAVDEQTTRYTYEIGYAGMLRALPLHKLLRKVDEDVPAVMEKELSGIQALLEH